jgi:Mg2+-importing ATPase
MAPELLPAITTIAMSAGAKRMLAKKVIVRKLSSIQNLGEVNLLCTDKTGTITEGAIVIKDIVDGVGNANEFVRTMAFWNANFESGYANPIDEALKGLHIAESVLPKKLGEIPYDFVRKRLSIAVETAAEKLLISKGAYNEIGSICTFIRLADGSTEAYSIHQPELQKQFEQYGTNGFRVIAVCYKIITKDSINKEDETAMIFAGFILLQDPVKVGIIDTINELKKLQVALKIITGDNKNVAKSIGLSIGIKDPIVMTGKELIDLNPEAIEQKVKEVHIFAEVEPQQKEHIIQALRKSYTVAYMGDGINDVSAINAADIGISVENAVDVAREAADFVLMEKDLSVLVDGIKEGRKTFANTLKYIYISTGSTFGNMCSVAVASLILPFLPMLPKQILLTNFITDFPYLTVASDNVDEEQLEKPGRWNLKLIRNYMVVFGVHSSVFDIITFLTLLYLLKVKEAQFQTGWFIESVLSELFILFIIRTHKNFFKSKPGNYLFLLSILGLIVTIGFPYMPFAKDVGLLPLPLLNIGVMLLIVMVYIVTADILKVWFFKRYKNFVNEKDGSNVIMK